MRVGRFAPANPAASRARWVTPPIPAEATALSFGLTLTENGELTTADYAMVEHSTPTGQ